VTLRNPPLAPRARWEKRLPSKYIVASIPSANSLEVEVQIQGTDIGAPVLLNALLDCGATGIFMDTEWACKNKITMRPLSRPILVYNIDGSPNAAGEIKDVAEVTLCYKDHTELAHFAITQLGKQNMILEYSWLRQHNPEVDWVAKEVTMSRCPTTCKTCTVATRLWHQIRRADARKSRKCRSGGFPALIEDCNNEDRPFHEDVEDLKGGVEDSLQASLPSISSRWMPDLIDIYDNEEIEEGNRIFVATIHPEDTGHFIRVMSTVSQRLAEAFAKNSNVPTLFDLIPTHLHDFVDVFSKESFDELPMRRKWDNAIELEWDVEGTST
jgi:hypothetical protein